MAGVERQGRAVLLLCNQRLCIAATVWASCAGGRHNMLPTPASWPLTYWPWKWCPSHVWRGLPFC